MQQHILYKRILAISFLTLYAFIYMPVQLWHHHSVIKERTGAVKFAKETVDTTTEDCSICQHTYTAYINDHSHFKIGTEAQFFNSSIFLDTDFPHPFISKASSRGPPPLV